MINLVLFGFKKRLLLLKYCFILASSIKLINIQFHFGFLLKFFNLRRLHIKINYYGEQSGALQEVRLCNTGTAKDPGWIPVGRHMRSSTCPILHP